MNLVEITMKFAFYTLGCKTNQYETQAMERLLLEMGHELGTFDEACHGYIIYRLVRLCPKGYVKRQEIHE